MSVKNIVRIGLIGAGRMGSFQVKQLLNAYRAQL